MAELGFPGFDHRGFVGSRRPPRRRRRSSLSSTSTLTRCSTPAAFRQRMEALGMTIPTDNTPETFAEFMRVQTARQAELAKLSGHAPLEPKR